MCLVISSYIVTNICPYFDLLKFYCKYTSLRVVNTHTHTQGMQPTDRVRCWNSRLDGVQCPEKKSARLVGRCAFSRVPGTSEHYSCCVEPRSETRDSTGHGHLQGRKYVETKRCS